MNPHDTICAIATAHGGAIGIIRISGENAFSIADQLFFPTKKNTSLAQQAGYTLSHGNIKDEAGNIIDEVLASVFHAPHSYTGEDSVEFMCHDSKYILDTVIRLLLQKGCRMAAPGEYTQRAFLNGKMDLSQAEAVADVITASSAAAHRVAMNQMRGGFSRDLNRLREQLLKLTALMELELDFSDHEELEFADRTELSELTEEIKKTIGQLTDSFLLGNALKDGIPVAIVGETNAGKSTLLNALLNEEKAIVSEIHGTTRDVIEDVLRIGDTCFRFIDTAGIRQTTDQIENLGIERSFQAIDKAQIILLTFDAQQGKDTFPAFFNQILPHLNGKKIVIVQNKCDTMANVDSAATEIPLPDSIQQLLKESLPEWEVISISALHKQNIEQLKQLLVDLSGIAAIHTGETIVTNARHYEALSHAYEAICRVAEGLDAQIPNDLIAQDLRECLHHLAEIAGEITTDSVLSHIFSHFCIGK